PDDLVVLLEPVLEQAASDVRRAIVTAVPPGIYRSADLRHEQQPAGAATGLVHAPAGWHRGILHEERGRLLSGPAPWDLRQVSVVGDHWARHGYFSSTSKACDVSLPKMSITLMRMR